MSMAVILSGPGYRVLPTRRSSSAGRAHLS
jgi:hypothetical protein